MSFVVFAKNISKMSAFYADTVGLSVSEQAATHTTLDGDAGSIVVHGIPADVAEGIAIDTPPRIREAAVFKPVFDVSSLEQVRIAAEKSGGGLKPAEDAWTFRGVTVLDGWDPEGNVVQFRQSDSAS